MMLSTCKAVGIVSRPLNNQALLIKVVSTPRFVRASAGELTTLIKQVVLKQNTLIMTT